MTRSWFLPSLAALLLGAVVTLSPAALATTDEEKAGARAAAVEGVRAFQEQRWSDVVDLFTRAEALVHSPMHLLYMARGNAQLGKLVLAREAYMKASRERIAEGSPPAFERARNDAHEELAALEPRLPYLTLKVEGAAPSAVTITMDGVKVPAPLIGLARPVDPGEHRFEVGGEGFAGDPVVVTLAEAERKTATMVVHAVAVTAKPTPTGAAVPVVASGPAGGPAEPPTKDQGGTSGLRIASYASLGLGVVGIGVGVLFGVKATGKRSEANDLCKGPGGCPLSKKGEIASLDDAANGASTAALIGFIAGGVGLAAGGTLFFLSAGTPKTETASVQPFVGLGSVGVNGRF